jgi:outer membrane protein
MIRKLAIITAAVFVLSLAALAQAPVAAQPTKIGIIDLQGAIVTTNEGQRDFRQLETKFEPTRAELQAGNAEVEKMKAQLNQQQSLLSEDARAKLMKDIDTKQKTLQRKFEDAQSDFGGQQNEIANRIGTKVYEIVKKYAAENGYAVVFNISQVSDQPNPILWAASYTDITKPVVDLYNTASGVPAPAPAAKPTATAPKPAAPAAPAAAKKP